MTQPLVECIANYSEARRPEVVEAIIQAISGVQSVYVLDRHSDTDHNRSVLTFVGPPEAVEEAAFRSIAKAAELINLDEHTGEHPRIGATDVVPFVPISGVTMQDCIDMARHLGNRVGCELGIAVYLYEEAATRPERKNLENIRRGQYETLKQEIATNPERAPDFGPTWIGPAGATVIGARHPLIAYNVYLTTEDLSIAKKIAKAVRFSSGGLRYVKALDMLVDGRAQVSMNLTNYRGTPVHRVVELIRREAARYGIAIHHSELVGLIPEEALIDSAVWYLQLDQFEPDQVLERRLSVIQPELSPLGQIVEPARPLDFLDELAAGTAAPGGGSAAAYAGAQAAALVAMVARLTVGKKKYTDVQAQMQELIQQAEALRSELTAAVKDDAAAFEKVMAASKMPKATPDQQQARTAALEETTLGAMHVPLIVARLTVRVLELSLTAITLGNVNTICDGGTAAALALAALEGATLNLYTNANTLPESKAAQEMLEELARLKSQATDLDRQIKTILRERGGLA